MTEKKRHYGYPPGPDAPFMERIRVETKLQWRMEELLKASVGYLEAMKFAQTHSTEPLAVDEALRDPIADLEKKLREVGAIN